MGFKEFFIFIILTAAHASKEKFNEPKKKEKRDTAIYFGDVGKEIEVSLINKNKIVLNDRKSLDEVRHFVFHSLVIVPIIAKYLDTSDFMCLYKLNYTTRTSLIPYFEEFELSVFQPEMSRLNRNRWQCWTRTEKPLRGLKAYTDIVKQNTYSNHNQPNKMSFKISLLKRVFRTFLAYFAYWLRALPLLLLFALLLAHAGLFARLERKKFGEFESFEPSFGDAYLYSFLFVSFVPSVVCIFCPLLQFMNALHSFVTFKFQGMNDRYIPGNIFPGSILCRALPIKISSDVHFCFNSGSNTYILQSWECMGTDLEMRYSTINFSLRSQIFATYNIDVVNSNLQLLNICTFAKCNVLPNFEALPAFQQNLYVKMSIEKD